MWQYAERSCSKVWLCITIRDPRELAFSFQYLGILLVECNARDKRVDTTTRFDRYTDHSTSLPFGRMMSTDLKFDIGPPSGQRSQERIDDPDSISAKVRDRDSIIPTQQTSQPKKPEDRFLPCRQQTRYTADTKIPRAFIPSLITTSSKRPAQR